MTRRPCLQVGNQQHNDYAGNTFTGILFRAPINHSSNPSYNGVLISRYSRISGLTTVNTATPHGFVTGDFVTILWTDHVNLWGDVPYITVTSPTQFTYLRPGAVDVPLYTGPGVVALAYDAILDNAQGTSFVDIKGTEVGSYGAFANFFDFWDDEAASVVRYDNGAVPMIRSNLWVGANFFSGGALNIPDKTHQLAPVIKIDGGSITAQDSACGTILNSNGFFVSGIVCQASGPWQWRVETATGNYGGGDFENVYAESSVGANPAAGFWQCPLGCSPWPGTGIAGLLTHLNVGSVTYRGAFTPSGQIQWDCTGYPKCASTATLYYWYWLVVHDLTTGLYTGPIPIHYFLSTNSTETPTIPWARWANGSDKIAYDLIRTHSKSAGIPSPMPYVGTGGCPGGTNQACGTVVASMAQCAGFVCNYTDNLATATTAYAVHASNWGGQMLGFMPATFGTTTSVAEMDHEPGWPSYQVGNSNNPSIIAQFCDKYGAPQPGGGYVVCPQGNSATNNASPFETAEILQDGSAQGGGQDAYVAKGRMIFQQWGLGRSNRHVITIDDSQTAFTRTVFGMRAPASPNDLWIGVDNIRPGYGQQNAQGFAFGGPVMITRYIASVGDAYNAAVKTYQERLTKTLEEYRVPVQVDPVPFASLTKCSAISEGTFATVSDSTVNIFGAVVAGGGTYHEPVYCNGTSWTVY
jgi:hypothetical protein